jgi:hypothetical protein
MRDKGEARGNLWVRFPETIGGHRRRRNRRAFALSQFEIIPESQ